jgi:hypothetical protein
MIHKITVAGGVKKKSNFPKVHLILKAVVIISHILLHLIQLTLPLNWHTGVFCIGLGNYKRIAYE